jgi:hypothetical protein
MIKILELMVALINNEDTQQLENELYYGDFDNFLNEYFHENWIIQKQNKL